MTTLTTVVALPSGLFRARCACDWTGALRETELVAQCEANAHAEYHREPLPYPDAHPEGAPA